MPDKVTLAKQHLEAGAEDAVAALVWIVKNSKRDATRVRAAMALLDRIGIIPGQRVEVTGADGKDIFEGMTLEEVQRIARGAANSDR